MPCNNADQPLEEWSAKENASAVHPAAKRPFQQLYRNSQLKSLLLLAALVAAFVLLRCYHKLTVVNSLGKRPLRSLAEGDGVAHEIPCRGPGLISSQSPASASVVTELSLQQRVEGVAKKLIQVVGNFSSIAFWAQPSQAIKLADLFLGFCIQEVAALSTLLGEGFEGQKAEVLQRAIEKAQALMEHCGSKETSRDQRRHAGRLVQYAKDLWSAEPEIISLPSETRSQHLAELLLLQEASIGLIEAATAPFLGLSGMQILEEAVEGLLQELERVIYTRREHVFSCKHLSHSLRGLEENRSRGKLVGPGNLEALLKKPKATLQQQLADLAGGGAQNTILLLQRKRLQKGTTQEGQAEGGEPKTMQSPATEGAQTSKSRPQRKHREYEVPPRLQHTHPIGQGERQGKWKRATAPKSGTRHSKQTKQTAGNPSPSHKRLSYPGTQDMPSQALATTSPPGPPLPNLGKSLSALSLSSPPSQDGHPSYGLLTSSVATSPQPPEPAAEEKWKAPGWRGHGATRSAAPTPESWSPWSSSWAPNVLFWPLLTTSGSTSATTASVGHSQEGVSSSQTSQQRLPDPH